MSWSPIHTGTETYNCYPEKTHKLNIFTSWAKLVKYNHLSNDLSFCKKVKFLFYNNKATEYTSKRKLMSSKESTIHIQLISLAISRLSRGFPECLQKNSLWLLPTRNNHPHILLNWQNSGSPKPPFLPFWFLSLFWSWIAGWRVLGALTSG